MSQNEKYYRNVILLLFSLFMAFSVGVFLFLKKHEIASRSYRFQPKKVTTQGYEYGIDHLAESSDELAIAGWLIRKATPIDSIERHVILKEKNSRRSRLLATEIIPREDLKSYGSDNVDYTYSGFYARIDKEELDDDKYYELYLLDEVNDLSVLVPLNQTIKEGEVQ